MTYDGTLEGEFAVWAKYDALTGDDLVEAFLRARDDANAAQWENDIEAMFQSRMRMFVAGQVMRSRGVSFGEIQEYLNRSRLGEENDG